MPAALVVEDEHSFANLLCQSLRRAGIEAICVDTAEEASVELSIKRYEFVLVDMTLPGSSGLYVVEAVRNIESAKRPVVIVMTATRGAILDKLDRGVVKAVIFKPLNVEALVAYVRALDPAYAR